MNGRDRGRRVILNPGAGEIILEGSEAGYADGVLWLYIRERSLAQAFALLSDPANTAVIRFEYGEMEKVYEGFTHITVLMDRDGEVAAALKKEADHV
jgi:hypothetical protein